MAFSFSWLDVLGKITVDSLLLSLSGRSLSLNLDGEAGEVYEVPVCLSNTDDRRESLGCCSVSGVALGFGLSPRISDTDLCRIAPDATLVVIRSGRGCCCSAGGRWLSTGFVTVVPSNTT